MDEFLKKQIGSISRFILAAVFGSAITAKYLHFLTPDQLSALSDSLQPVLVGALTLTTSFISSTIRNKKEVAKQ